jgi:hypothetical protein
MLYHKISLELGRGHWQGARSFQAVSPKSQSPPKLHSHHIFDWKIPEEKARYLR